MSREHIKFSIIVPVYNVEKYLEECIESLVNQTYGVYEIILVDDGSTDGSVAICDRYAEKYFIVKVFHKPNGGLSDARNYGVDKASGEYMIFVDSDDYIDKDTLQIYFQACCQNDYPDLLIDQSNYVFRDNEAQNYNCYYDYKVFGKKSGKEAFRALSSGFTLWSACAKCYKVEYWRKCGFQFTKGIYAEDMDLIYKVVYLADSVVMTPTTYYYREKRDGSITNTISKKKFMDLFCIVDGWEDFFEKYQVDDICRNNMYFLFGERMISVIMRNLFLLDKDERKELSGRLRDYRYVIKKYNGKWGKIINILIGFIGIRNTSFLLHLYGKITYKNY